MVFIAVLIIALVSFVLVWLASLLIEALRQAPGSPDAMPWDPNLKPTYVAVQTTADRGRRARPHDAG